MDLNLPNEESSSDDYNSDNYSDIEYEGFMHAQLLAENHSPEGSLAESNNSTAEDHIWNSQHVRAKCIAFYSKINEYFGAEEYTDVNIICQERVFKCHRIVLASASEYFHLMFCGSFRERNDKDVVLHDIDSVTFNRVLHCMYTGDVGAVDEDNVYDLLRASEILQLKTIENRCVNYLNQRKIPMDYAIEIFTLAHVTGKESLLPVMSRFILAHSNHFCADESFLKISFDELKTILCYSSFFTSCESNERDLLEVILRWTLHSTGTCEEQKNLYTQLTQTVKFKHTSTKYIQEHFQRHSTNELGENCSTNAVLSSVTTTTLDSQICNREPSLFLYVNGFDPIMTKYESYQSRLDKQDIELAWSTSRVTESAVDQMRTVVLDERLYCMKSHQSRLTFDICSSADLCPVHTLSPPDSEHYNGFPYFMCHDYDNIYFLHCNHEVYAYKRDFNTWSSVLPMFRQRFFPTMMTYLDHRLYLIGSKTFKYPHRHRDRPTSDALRAYDPRIGKLEKLASCKNPHSLYNDECCSYNGRIYATHGERRKTYIMDIYDPRAGKWDVILRKAKQMHNFSFFHRLLSFDHHLWIFYSESNDTIACETYDSFLQDWEAETSLNHVFENRKCPRIIDAVIF